jgi:hypothetical protein
MAVVGESKRGDDRRDDAGDDDVLERGDES